MVSLYMASTQQQLMRYPTCLATAILLQHSTVLLCSAAVGEEH
jgi:hypothetical protein